MIIFVLYSASTLLIWQFVGYPLLMSLIVLLFRQTRIYEETSYEEFVSILIATFNEEKVILNRIENILSLNYPNNKCEIIVIDSGSTDNTRRIVKQKMASNDKNPFKLKLIEETNRNGKASAINLGISESQGNLILIADANSIYEKDVLTKLTSVFHDPKVGAVSGRYKVLNSKDNLAASESFYWDLENIVFSGESKVDSISTVVGTISMWRKELLNFDLSAVSEDLDMTLQIRRKGFKIKYVSDAVVYESAAVTSEDQIKQRKRTAIGTLQCIMRNRYYFLFPTDIFSFLIFPSHKILPMISPFLLLSIFVCYIILLPYLSLIFMHILLNFVLFSFLFSLLLSLKSKITTEKDSTKISLNSVPLIFKYVLLNEYLILLAWKGFLSGKYSVLWEKATSTRNV